MVVFTKHPFSDDSSKFASLKMKSHNFHEINNTYHFFHIYVVAKLVHKFWTTLRYIVPIISTAGCNKAEKVPHNFTGQVLYPYLLKF